MTITNVYLDRYNFLKIQADKSFDDYWLKLYINNDEYITNLHIDCVILIRELNSDVYFNRDSNMIMSKLDELEQKILIQKMLT